MLAPSVADSRYYYHLSYVRCCQLETEKELTVSCPRCLKGHQILITCTVNFFNNIVVNDTSQHNVHRFTLCHWPLVCHLMFSQLLLCLVLIILKIFKVSSKLINLLSSYLGLFFIIPKFLNLSISSFS